MISAVTLINVSENNMLGDYLRARRELIQPDGVGLPRVGCDAWRDCGVKRSPCSPASAPTTTCGSSRAATVTPQFRCSRRSPACCARPGGDRLLAQPGHAAALQRRCPRREIVPAGIRQLLDVVGLPAFAEGRYFDVLAANSSPAPCRPTCRPARTGSARCSSTRPRKRSIRTGTATPPASSPASASPSEPIPKTRVSSGSSANCPCPVSGSGNCGPGTRRAVHREGMPTRLRQRRPGRADRAITVGERRRVRRLPRESGCSPVRGTLSPAR